MDDQNEHTTNQSIKNPFPGLWHYKVEQHPYYYIDQLSRNGLISRLMENNFLAIVGEPGCGKASLLNCGIIPELINGLGGKAGDKWEYTILRPGTDPIRNLAEHLAHSKMFFGGGKVEPNFEDRLEKKLRSSSNGLVEIFEDFTLKDGYNFFIAIDELEDLFILDSLIEDKEDNRAFVNLFLRFFKKKHPAVYVVFALASDFLGESAKYHGLPNAINKGQYLLTAVDELQVRKFVPHAFRTAAIDIDDELIDLIIADYLKQGADIYQLQYALKRLVDHWLQDTESSSKLEVDYYRKIGQKVQIPYAIQYHAEEIYESFNDHYKKICEMLFKAITKDQDFGIESSLALEVRRLAEIAECSEEDMIEVVTKFSEEEFDLMHIVPPDDVLGKSNSLKRIHDLPPPKLSAHSKVMLLSPVFIGQWHKLRMWKQDEKKNADTFLRLVDAEMTNRELKDSDKKWYSNAELDMILDWYHNTVNNEEWAKRYALTYQEAIAFLMENEQRRTKKLESDKREEDAIKRKRFWIYTGLVAASVIFLILAGWALREQREAHDIKSQIEIEKRRLNFVQNLDSIHTIYVDALEDIESSELKRLIEEVENEDNDRKDVLQFASTMIALDKKCKADIKEKVADIHNAKAFWRDSLKGDNIDYKAIERRIKKDSSLVNSLCIMFENSCLKQGKYITFFNEKCSGTDD